MELLALLVVLVCGCGGVEGALRVKPTSVVVGSGAADRHNHEEALFSCIEILPDTPPHRPRSEVVWIKDGQVIDTSSRKYRNFGKKKWLLIRDLTETDGGVYECAFTPNATEKGRAELWIAPRILEAPSPQTLFAGSNQTVLCRVSAGVRAVEWSVGGTVVASETAESDQGSRLSILADGSLRLSPALPSDGGIFRCSTGNKAGREEADITVSIEGDETTPLPSKDATPPPSAGTTPSPGDAPVPVTLLPPSGNCVELLDVSFPQPSTTPSPPLVSMTAEPVVHNNSRGMPAAMVHTLPSFILAPPSCAHTLVGYTVVLRCSAVADPPPTITWSKERQHIASNQSSELQGGAHYHYQVLPDGSLQINRVQASDRGRYTCTASNSVGSMSQSVRLTVVAEGDVCGVGGGGGRQRRVTEGVAVTSTSDWPWQVLIEYPTILNPDLLCGGALVRPDWVVTAAHCLFSPPSRLTPDALKVRVGVWNRSRDELSQQRLEVQEIFVHPDYSSRLFSAALPEFDIALLKLRRPARLTSSTGLVCLPQRNQDPPAGTECAVTGWGHLQYGSSSSPLILHQATVPLVPHSQCRSQRSYGNQVSLNMLCAGHEEGGADACQNDSGGPLVCPDADTGRSVLYGVVNSGDGCGKPHKYGIYARIIKFRRWITSLMALSS